MSLDTQLFGSLQLWLAAMPISEVISLHTIDPLLLLGFLLLHHWNAGNPGRSGGGGSGGQQRHSPSSHNHLDAKRFCRERSVLIFMKSLALPPHPHSPLLRAQGCLFGYIYYFFPCRWYWDDGKNFVCLDARVSFNGSPHSQELLAAIKPVMGGQGSWDCG